MGKAAVNKLKLSKLQHKPYSQPIEKVLKKTPRKKLIKIVTRGKKKDRRKVSPGS